MRKGMQTTDFHLYERGFKSRTDDWKITSIEKLKNIDKYLMKNKDIEVWLDSGDFFHTTHQGTKLINSVIKTFKNFKRQDIFPIIAIAGNHITKRNAEKFIGESGLKTLESCGYIKIVEDPHIGKYGDRKIMMNHISVVPEPVIWEHSTYKEIDEMSSVDYFLCSHEHTPQPVTTVGTTTFIAPGSLSRGTGSEKNHYRDPAIAVFTLEGKKEVEYVPIMKDSFPFVEKSVSVDIEANSSALVDKINNVWNDYEKSSMDFTKIVEHFRNSDDSFDNNVLNYCLDVKERLE